MSAMQQDCVLPRDLLSRVTMKPRVTESQDAWGWEIAGYLYLGGLGAGAFIIAVLLDWFGFRLAPAHLSLMDGWNWDWSQILVLWGPLSTTVGASLLILHLGKNWFLFFTACLNPRTAWLARGFLILATFIVAGSVVAAVAVFLPGLPARLPFVWRSLQATGLVLAFGTAIYTGILLQSMKYIPAWNAVHLPFLFLASALSTGSMGVVVGATAYRFIVSAPASAQVLVQRIEVAEPIIIIVEATVLALYLRHLMKGKLEGQASAKMMLSGPWRFRFWIGIVAGALVLPFLLVVIGIWIRSVDGARVLLPLGISLDFVADVATVTAAATTLIGGFVLRVGVLAIGIKERPPLYGLSRWRAEHAVRLVREEVTE
jgi:formate-dependent nitrite reductase membrane component NrfD